MLLREHMATTVFYSVLLVNLDVACLAPFGVNTVFYCVPESKLLFFR